MCKRVIGFNQPNLLLTSLAFEKRYQSLLTGIDAHHSFIVSIIFVILLLVLLFDFKVSGTPAFVHKTNSASYDATNDNRKPRRRVDIKTT
jgi:hypothetical protein